jgi:hypothetical protein
MVCNGQRMQALLEPPCLRDLDRVVPAGLHPYSRVWPRWSAFASVWAGSGVVSDTPCCLNMAELCPGERCVWNGWNRVGGPKQLVVICQLQLLTQTPQVGTSCARTPQPRQCCSAQVSTGYVLVHNSGGHASARAVAHPARAHICLLWCVRRGAGVSVTAGHMCLPCSAHAWQQHGYTGSGW